MLPAKILQLVIDEGFLKENVRALLIYIGLLFLTYISKSIFTYTSNRQLIEIGNDILKRIKSEIYARLMSMDLTFYSKNDIGYINARVEEINSIDIIFSSQTLVLCSSLIEFILALVILYSLNWKVLIVLSIPIPILILVSYYISKKINTQIKKTLESSAEYHGKIQDTIRGMETVKSQGLEEKESEKVDEMNKTALDNQKKQSHTINSFSVGMSSVGSIINVLIYLIGGLFFIYNDLTMGSFIAISTYAMKLYSPILNYASMSVLIQPAFLALKRVSEFFFNEKQRCEEEVLIDKIESIEFDNLYFSYPDSEEIFNGLNLRIDKGDKIHLTGPNGSGKSTLIRLLLKLIEPTDGNISINGLDLSTINKSSLISNVSYVAQRNYVFNDSIENNIKYGIENPDATLYELIIRGLNLTDVIDRLNSEGNDKIGENGARLSGGEIQKICIARALLLNKEFIIFDEALTNLDNDSFLFIMDIIKDSSATWIVIDHKNKFDKYGFKQISLRKRSTSQNQ